MTHLRIFLLASAIFFAGNLFAGPKFTYDDGKSSMELFSQAQFWSVGTYAPNDVPEPAKRLDFYLRRARIGLRGQVRPRLDYLFSFAFDNLGKDPYTGTIGTGQKLENTEFRVWDAYFMYHLDTTWANVSFGLQRPVVSREYTSPYTGVTSLEYALTFYYLRDHLTTRPSARETGINIGGQYADSNRIWGVVYDAGVFDATQEKTSDLTGSAYWSPLVTGRLGVSIGQPESQYHKLSYDLNAFGKRKGVTISGYTTWQGRTDEKCDPKDTFNLAKGTFTAKGYKGGFNRNTVVGADLLANYLGLTLDGEYSVLRREFTDAFQATYKTIITATSYTDKVWHVRAGYSIPVFGSHFIEPAILYTEFDGDKNSVNYPAGRDKILDAGVNWYVNKNNLKVSLHWLNQSGAPKSMFAKSVPDPKTGAYKERDDAVVLGVQLLY
jgi:hypothetical protein